MRLAQLERCISVLEKSVLDADRQNAAMTDNFALRLHLVLRLQHMQHGHHPFMHQYKTAAVRTDSKLHMLA